jgi:3-methyladenine DNA glycosylase AlkD
MNTILNELRQELTQNIDPKTQESGQKFFKESVKLYGIKSATVNKIGKAYFKAIKDRKKTEIFDLCEELWRSGYLEESFIACHWSYFIHKDYEPNDFKVFEKWVSHYVTNWASCDTLCNHTIGAFLDMYPESVATLKSWTSSTNRWMRRASAVSLIIPAKEGDFLNDILEIADALLLDPDDLVQKGYGWLLKAACNKHQTEIFDYIIQKKALMPRTALRYAIEKMPKELKSKAMKK